MSKTTFIAFVMGAATGAVGAWYYAKKKYERIAQEEIDSVKETYSKKDTATRAVDSDSEEHVKPDVLVDKPDIMKFAARLRDEGYNEYSSQGSKKQDETPGDRPYVISPDEFGEYDDYTKISLMYYEDQILADEMDQPVENVEEIIGFDSLNHFGEYEDDSVFVRNDARKCDYEILRSLRRYSEVIREKPYRADV